jgi:hypothetical protein
MTERPQIKLPKNVISFDIETEMVADWSNRELTPVLFVGWKRYTYDSQQGWYDQTIPYHWLPVEKLSQSFFDQMGAIEGVMIGHNLFDFDYRVLWQHGDLSAVIAKTCDTLTTLRVAHPRGKGLKLDDLGKINFEAGKNGTAEDAIRYYKDPDLRQHALDYNEQDCVLVFKVWEQLVRQQTIEIEATSGRKTLDVTLPMLEVLTGARPQLTAAEFLAHNPRLLSSSKDVSM